MDSTVTEVAKQLGAAAAAFLVAWMWISSLRSDNKALRKEVADARQESIATLERVLPLVTSVSEVVEANKREAMRAQQDRSEAVLARLEQKLGRLE